MVTAGLNVFILMYFIYEDGFCFVFGELDFLQDCRRC